MPRIKIDNFTPIDQPRGFEGLDIVIQYDEIEKTLLVDTNGMELTFLGDAYNYLTKSRKENGYNGVHNVEISMLLEETTFDIVFNGNLFISDCDLDRKSVV